MTGSELLGFSLIVGSTYKSHWIDRYTSRGQEAESRQRCRNMRDAEMPQRNVEVLRGRDSFFDTELRAQPSRRSSSPSPAAPAPPSVLVPALSRFSRLHLSDHVVAAHTTVPRSRSSRARAGGPSAALHTCLCDYLRPVGIPVRIVVISRIGRTSRGPGGAHGLADTQH